MNKKNSLGLTKKHAPRKRLGQNFLIDNKKLITTLDQIPIFITDHVIEIGSGLGALTKLLSPRVKTITAFEIDTRFSKYLEELQLSNVTVKNEDFLKAKFEWEQPRKVVANIPYYITTDLLFKLFENNDKFSHAFLMVQEEVAQRITSKVGDSSYGKLTITTQYFGKVKYLIKVPANNFYPKPKVDSAIIQIDFHFPLWNKNESKEFLLFVKKCFAMRRKTLINNLKKEYSISFLKIFNQLSIKLNIRPQNVTLNQYQKLFQYLKSQNTNQ